PKEAGKLLAKMVEKVAARFGVVVTEKFAAQAVPSLVRPRVTLGVAPKEAGKLLAKMVEKVAARFGVVVTEKFAAQAVP
ncbi:hypothetical protein C7E12_22220, partial [Stenotrophomonas maltophilia]